MNLLKHEQKIMDHIVSATNAEGYCFSTDEEIAKDTGLSQRTVTTVLSQFRTRKMITTVKAHKRVQDVRS